MATVPRTDDGPPRTCEAAYHRYLGSFAPVGPPSDLSVMLEHAHYAGRADAIATLAPLVREEPSAIGELARLSRDVFRAMNRLTAARS